MSIILDHQLREKMAHDASAFPISYFQDELALLPNQAGPLHWHPEFEIATAVSGVLEYQVGQERITLASGDSILVGGNMLHSIRQLSGDNPDPMPNIVFFGSLIATENSTIYAQYIQPIIDDHALPYVVFRYDSSEHAPVNTLIQDIYRLLREQPRCYEMAVQRHLSSIFEYLMLHFDDLPRTEATRVQLNTQVRVQQMLAFIHAHYAEEVTLADIAGAASISRSEAGRCFRAYMGCSPVDALIQHRLQKAHGMLHSLYCNICNAILVPQETIPAKGHNITGLWQFDHTEHWALCNCGEMIEKATHVDIDSNACCDDCQLYINALELNASVVLPTSLEEIGNEAFLGMSAESVRLPDGLIMIGSRAFANCPNLYRIAIPVSVTTISPDAFDDCSKNLIIYCTANSEAHLFATKFGYYFAILHGSDR